MNKINFTDGDAVLFSGDNWNEVLNNAEKDLNVTLQWLHRNKLSLNFSQTKLICFGTNKNSLPSCANSITRSSSILVFNIFHKASKNCYFHALQDNIKIFF